jgi:hypothetical protein
VVHQCYWEDLYIDFENNHRSLERSFEACLKGLPKPDMFLKCCGFLSSSQDWWLRMEVIVLKGLSVNFQVLRFHWGMELLSGLV